MRNDRICLQVQDAGWGNYLTIADVELALVEIAFDDVAVEIALGQFARPVGAGIVGDEEVAADMVDGQLQVAVLDLDDLAVAHIRLGTELDQISGLGAE